MKSNILGNSASLLLVYTYIIFQTKIVTLLDSTDENKKYSHVLFHSYLHNHVPGHAFTPSHFTTKVSRHEITFTLNAIKYIL